MSDKILKLDQAQTLYQDLRGRIDALPTNEDITVTDVQVNGTSVVTNGVANVPIATNNAPGLMQASGQTNGLYMSGNSLYIACATETDIKAADNFRKPIVPRLTNYSAFYGLAKAAGDSTQSASSNTVGNYTDNAKQKIQNMLGVTDLLSTEETTTATAAHALNSTFMMNGKLHCATAAIAIGDAVEVGTNCEVVKVEDVFVKKTDYADNGEPGIAKYAGFGVEIATSGVDRGFVKIKKPNDQEIQSGAATWRTLTPDLQHKSVFYGLSKVAGVDLASETVTLGTYPETSKTAIRSLIGAAAASDIPSVPVQDVQVNGTSVLSQGVANVPVADATTYGVAKVSSNLGVNINQEGFLTIGGAASSVIKSGNSSLYPITTVKQHESVFYGLTKAAGVDMASSSNPVGTYTNEAKVAIRNMLGAASTNIVAVQDEQPTNTDTKVWLPETQAAGIQVPTMEDLGDYVQKTDYATKNDFGIVKIGNGMAVSNGIISVINAPVETVKNGSSTIHFLTPARQDASTFYGLAKAAGADLASAENITVGTYPTTASAAIRSMLGAIGSEDYATENAYGLVKVNSSYGIAQNSGSGSLQIVGATAAQCKSRVGSTGYQPLTVYTEDASAFYGLAYAAGDTTMTSSSNAIGTYTDSAKASIKSMLGIVDGSTGTVDITGTTPSITAVENTRYVCGEVSTLSFTPAASGICIVRFTSGSTATVLTVPNTVKFPEWFDITALEADTIYEMCITDGVYGAVMSWAL